MRLISSLLAIGALALLFAESASAATTSGTVTATDTPSRSVTIRSDDGKELRFSSNDATRIEREGTKLTLEELPMGVHVSVTTPQAPAEAESAMLASRIQVHETIAPVTSGSQSEVTVESAGPDGGQPQRTVQVESGDYSQEAPLQSAASRLPLIAMLGIAALAIAGILRLRRR